MQVRALYNSTKRDNASNRVCMCMYTQTRYIRYHLVSAPYIFITFFPSIFFLFLKLKLHLSN